MHQCVQHYHVDEKYKWGMKCNLREHSDGKQMCHCRQTISEAAA